MPFWIIMRKDLKIIFRDRTALVFIFAMPLMFILFFGMIFRGGGPQRNPVKLLVVNQDKGPHGAEFIAALRKNGLTVEEETAGAEILKERVKEGKRPMGVIIPPEFSAELEKAAQARFSSSAGATTPQAQLNLVVDPAQANYAGMAQGAIYGAIGRVTGALFGENETAKPLIALNTEQVSKTEAEPSPGNIMVPSYAVLFVFFMANGVAISLIVERQEGTLRRMLSSPVTRNQVLLGKLLARGFLGVLQTLMLFGIGKVFLNLALGSSLLGLVLIALSTIFAASGLGLLIATFGKSMEQIQAMVTLILLGMGAISGCMVPRMLLPETLQKVSLITPHAWALEAYQNLLIRNLPLSSVWLNIGVVILFGLGFYALALTRFRFE